MSLEKIANYAGVSTATVSRVLNAVPVVSPSTVRVVRKAIDALKYDPGAVKRGPRPGSGNSRSNGRPGTAAMIAIVVVGVSPDRPRSISHDVIDAIIRSAKKSGLRVLMDHMQDLADMSSIIRNREVQGAIVMLADDAPLDILDEMNRYVPVVWAMGGHAGPVGVDHVSENNTAVGYLAQAHLRGLGCRDVAFLSASPQKRNAIQRAQAFMAAAEGLDRCRSFILGQSTFLHGLYGPEVTSGADFASLLEALCAAKPPDGLFIDRDRTTARVYPLLSRFGLEPGRDIKIISCDNDDLALSGLSPRPATIDLGIAELASMIVQRVLSRIGSCDEPSISLQATPQLKLGQENDHRMTGQLELAVPV
jgi:DNA-binding LacI/PurR family transcriptional regulator